MGITDVLDARRIALDASADVHVFADLCDLSDEDFTDSAFFAVGHILDALCADLFCIQRDVGQLFDEFDEFFVLCDEVGLGVDLDSCGCGAVCCERHSYEAFGSDTAGLLGCLRESVFSQIVDCLIDVAFGSNEGLLAVHHAGAGHFTEFFYECCCNCCHCISPLITLRL